MPPPYSIDCYLWERHPSTPYRSIARRDRSDGTGQGDPRCKRLACWANPKGDVTPYTFGSTYAVDEGMFKQSATNWNGSTALRTMTTRFNRSFTQLVGTSDQNRCNN
jgi:hypothetical protein